MTQKDNTEEEVKQEEPEKTEETIEETNENSSKNEIDSKDEEIGKLKKEIEDQKDQMLRRQADFENYKKRSLKQQEDFKKLAIKDFACDIININDDLIRAIEASESMENKDAEESHSSFVQGVKMISSRIIETLRDYGIEEIDAHEQPFDPMYHEAIEMEDSEHHETDTVTKVHQKGFKLDDLVIRSAKVKVAKPKQITNGKESKEASKEETK